MTRRANRTSDMHDLVPQHLELVRGGDGDADRKKRKDLPPIIITKKIDAPSPML